jgi:hypothetical protein
MSFLKVAKNVISIFVWVTVSKISQQMQFAPGVLGYIQIILTTSILSFSYTFTLKTLSLILIIPYVLQPLD